MAVINKYANIHIREVQPKLPKHPPPLPGSTQLRSTCFLDHGLQIDVQVREASIDSCQVRLACLDRRVRPLAAPVRRDHRVQILQFRGRYRRPVPLQNDEVHLASQMRETKLLQAASRDRRSRFQQYIQTLKINKIMQQHLMYVEDVRLWRSILEEPILHRSLHTINAVASFPCAQQLEITSMQHRYHRGSDHLSRDDVWRVGSSISAREESLQLENYKIVIPQPMY